MLLPVLWKKNGIELLLFFLFVVNFVIHWNEKALGSHVFPIPIPPPTSLPPAPSRSSQSTRSERLSHASNLGWWSVSPLMVYMFRCCSLETSHPRLLPQSPKVCSVHDEQKGKGWLNLLCLVMEGVFACGSHKWIPSSLCDKINHTLFNKWYFLGFITHDRYLSFFRDFFWEST